MQARSEVTYGCGQLLELHAECVELAGREEDHVEDLHHVRGKGQLLLRVQDLGESAVHAVGPHVDAQLPRGSETNKQTNKQREGGVCVGRGELMCGGGLRVALRKLKNNEIH